MKTLAVALLVFGPLAHAQYRPARDLSTFAAQVKLTWNTHPNSPCPEYTSIALTAVDGGNATLLRADGVSEEWKYGGYRVMNYSDVGQDLYNSYSPLVEGVGQGYLSLSFNNDGDWPATRLPGFSNLTLSTGVQGRSGVYYGQICGYRVL